MLGRGNFKGEYNSDSGIIFLTILIKLYIEKSNKYGRKIYIKSVQFGGLNGSQTTGKTNSWKAIIILKRKPIANHWDK